MSPQPIHVVIVNYGNSDSVIEGLLSIEAHLSPQRRVVTHVVDNNSPHNDADNIAQFLKENHFQKQEIIFYPETINHGFGRGNNVALVQIAQLSDDEKPEYVFLLNPDAWLKNDAISSLADFLDAHPRAAIAGARSFFPDDGSPQVSAFRFPSIVSVFVVWLGVGPVSRLFQRYRVPLDANIPTQLVGWVTGAGFMARLDVLKEVGFFDPEYFLYYEEVDLMLNCTRKGWEVWHVREAEFFHLEGQATNMKSRAPERRRRPAYWYRSWAYYFMKNHGRLAALAAAMGWMTAVLLNMAIVSPIAGRKPFAPLHFFGDFWRAGVRPILGLKPKSY